MHNDLTLYPRSSTSVCPKCLWESKSSREAYVHDRRKANEHAGIIIIPSALPPWLDTARYALLPPTLSSCLSQRSPSSFTLPGLRHDQPLSNLVPSFCFYAALLMMLLLIACEQTHNDDVELNVLGCRVDIIIRDKL